MKHNPLSGSTHGQVGNKLTQSLTTYLIFLVIRLLYKGGPIASREGIVKYVETLQGFCLIDCS